MKIIPIISVLSAVSVILCGCSASSKAETPSQIQQAAEFTSEQQSMPVLSIETKNKSDNVLDFVTEPFALHVSEAIASWTPGFEIPPAPYYEDCSVTLRDKDGNTILEPADAQVKVRGNWTTVYQKKPLKIKFAEKQGMLSLNDGAEQKNWLLLAEYKDASMLRNKAALYASRSLLGQHDLFAADGDFVQVEINGEYFGVYLLTDMQQVNSSRVDITEPEPDYKGTDIGYFLEFDGYFYQEDELNSFPLDLADNAPLTPYDGKGGSGQTVQCLSSSPADCIEDVGITIKSDINSKEQHDFIENYVNSVYRIMYEAAYNDKAYVFDANYSKISESKDITPRQAVENVVDVQSLVDMYIISELTCDADIYWSSFYMDADFGADGNKKLTFEAPWDFDSAMGNKDRCIDGTGFYASNKVPDVNGGTEGGGMYDTANPWLVVLAYEDWYQDMIKDTWTKAYDDGIFSNTIRLVQTDSQKYKDDFTKNYDKWNNIIDNEEFGHELSAPAAKCRTEEEAAQFLADWLTKRVDFLNSQWHK